MKRLLLTSSGSFITSVDTGKIFGKPLQNMKIAYIITASKKVFDTDYINKHRKVMTEQGFDYEEIDIAGKNKNELKEILKNKEAIYVEGGNTFYLLQQARKSGFNEIVRELVDKGVIYIGSSAGSYLACPTIEMAVKARDYEFDECGITDYTSIGLVPFLIKAHYTSENSENMLLKAKTSKYPIRLLTDSQAIFVQGDSVKLLGGGEEIII